MKQALSRAILITALLYATACDRTAPRAEGGQSAKSTKLATKQLKPYPGAIKVRLFVEAGRDERGNPHYSKSDGLLLSVRQRQQFEELLATQPVPEEMAACFIPHHFFRYYNQAEEQIGEISVCFCCDGIRDTSDSGIALEKGEMLSADYGRLAKLVHSWGEKTDFECFAE